MLWLGILINVCDRADGQVDCREQITLKSYWGLQRRFFAEGARNGLWFGLQLKESNTATNCQQSRHDNGPGSDLPQSLARGPTEQCGSASRDNHQWYCPQSECNHRTGTEQQVTGTGGK